MWQRTATDCSAMTQPVNCQRQSVLDCLEIRNISVIKNFSLIDRPVRACLRKFVNLAWLHLDPEPCQCSSLMLYKDPLRFGLPNCIVSFGIGIVSFQNNSISWHSSCLGWRTSVLMWGWTSSLTRTMSTWWLASSSSAFYCEATRGRDHDHDDIIITIIFPGHQVTPPHQHQPQEAGGKVRNRVVTKNNFF